MQEQSFIRHLLVNLNQTRPKYCRFRDTSNRRQITRGENNSSQGKTVTEGAGIEWEVGSDPDLSAVEVNIDLLDLSDERGVLLVDEDELETGAVRLPFWSKAGLGDVKAELNVLVLGLDVLCVNSQGA